MFAFVRSFDERSSPMFAFFANMFASMRQCDERSSPLFAFVANQFASARNCGESSDEDWRTNGFLFAVFAKKIRHP